MATKIEPGRGPGATAEGYSTSGSQAKRVALNPGGTLSAGNRFSVSGPVRGGPSPAQVEPPSRIAHEAPSPRTEAQRNAMGAPIADTRWSSAVGWSEP